MKKFTTLASIDPIRRPADGEKGDRHRVAERCRPGDILGGDRPVLVERQARRCAPALGRGLRTGPADGRPAGKGLEAADVAAPADDARIVDDLDVADVAGTALGAAMEPAVADDPGADARADLDDDDVVVARGDTRSAIRRGRGR